MANKEVFSTHEVARMCHVHHTTIINWINSGKMPSYTTPGGHRRVKRADLIAFIEQYEMPRPPELSKSERSVLLVDDDSTVLSEFTEALREQDLVMDVASDGFEAGKKIYGHRPDLILLDFRMPGMDGFEVCRSLRKEKSTSDIPVVAVTVLASRQDRTRMKELGVEWYMEKPVDMRDLIGLIKMILDLDPASKELTRKYSLKGR